jgi:O-Antigen ligase
LTNARSFSLFCLLALVVGLAVHNAAMAQLWELGVRGNSLDVVAAWKEVLLLAAIAALAWKVRDLPAVTVVDVFAGVYAAVILLYFFVPQGWLDGAATGRGELLALRHHLLPVAGYVLGRLLASRWRADSFGLAVVLTAAGVTFIGLIDLGVISLQAWRDSGVPDWYRDQLGLDYEGLSGLPENWVYNTGDEENPVRRLVSTFLSPLASSYVLVVALLYVFGRRLRWWSLALGAIVFVGLLYTHTRSAVAALAVGLVVLAIVLRRLAPAVLALAAVVIAALFFAAYPSIGPSTSYTDEELAFLRQNAEQEGATSGDPFSTSESSFASHWRNLRDGVRTVLEHPQGYGLGNAGVTAKRTGVEIKGGESTYVELGVDAGFLGVAAFVLWCLALLRALWTREAWLAAAFAAVLALGLQTDVIGVHWVAVAVWALAGIALAGPREEEEEAEPGEEANVPA